jgi:hypothetical protein
MGLDHGYTVTWGNEAGKKTVLSALVDYPGWKIVASAPGFPDSAPGEIAQANARNP